MLSDKHNTTMKKYIIPAINVAEIELQSLICESIGIGGDTTDNQLANRRQRLSSTSKYVGNDDDEYEYDFE